jgi:hypothetical protein
MAGTSKSVNSANGRGPHQVVNAAWAGSSLMPILDISALSIIYAVCVVRGLAGDVSCADQNR